MTKRWFLFIGAIFSSGSLLFTGCERDAGPGAPTGLVCELLEDPALTVITDPRPEFGWVVNDSRRGAVQYAYQIIVSSSLENAERGTGDIWDSGEVRSAQSVNVELSGKELSEDSEYFWKVRTWDGEGNPGPYSVIQKFRTGKLAEPTEAALLHTHDFSNRYPLVKTEVPPVRLARKAAGHFFVDFGRAAFGTVALTLSSEAAGQVEVHLGEVPAKEPDTIHRTPGGSRRYRKMVVALKPGTHTYLVAITPDKRNTSGAAVLMPPGLPEVMPFRYAELIGAPDDLTRDQIRQVAVHYKWNEDASAFSSSSKVLNDVWDLCKYSIKATSFMGVYIDGDRERIPYEGDAFINQLCHYGVDREFTLARYSTEYLMHYPTWPADWQLHMPLMAWADYLHTGNTEFLGRYYEDLAAKTLIALAREDGLIVEDKAKMTPEFKKSIRLKEDVRILVDWPPASFTRDSKYGERDNYDMRPVNTVANAFHYRTLVLMADIARALGKEDEARRWSDRAVKLRKVFNEVFFDPQHGRYIDGEGSTHSALHANMFPLAFGLVPAEHVAGVVKFIESRGMACSVYGAQYLMDGLYYAGASDYALSLLTATHDRSWAHMIYTVGSTITTEAWDNKYKENQDWNHAWGAVPANAIPRLLMGIEPLEPGFARMRIRPQIASLKEAQITTPTIRGPVKLHVSQPNERTWRASVTIPANTTAEIHVPAADPVQVFEGGRAATGAPHVKFLRMDEGRTVFEIRGGSYEFEMRGNKPTADK
jgi:alpha-L-rhamnosidase